MGNDPFANMSHEEMLAWLDQAHPAVVQAGADKLLAAAKEIEKIAEELKTRPQYVEWKGQGADSFRAWAGDLANATLRVADYSADNGNFLSHTADAIARTKSSIPRDDGGAQADIDAAKAARNDPDSATVLAKATAQKEAVRQQAADEMNKLGQTYQQSAERMTSMKPPTIPPPPDAIVPGKGSSIQDVNGIGFSGGTGGSTSGSGTGSVAAPAGYTSAASSGQSSGQPSTHRAAHVEAAARPAVDPERPVSMGIDSTATLPETNRLPSGPTTGTPPTQGPASTSPVLLPVPVPPPATGPTGRTGMSPGTRLPTGPSTHPGQVRAGGTSRPVGPGTGRPVAGTPGFSEGRTSPVAGRSSTGTPNGRTPGTSDGIYGGRPSQQQTGRTTPYRGTVVGGETEGRATSGSGRTVPGAQTGGRPTPGTRAGGRPGAAPESTAGRTLTERGKTPTGQRTSAPSRGVMGAPPAQRAARTGSGERAVPGSASVSRDGIAGGSAASESGGKGRAGTGGVPTSSSPRRRQEERGGERPDFVTEDEETWQADRRRIVPPTVD